MMKLEDYKKLKQSDRIEFLLRRRHIEDSKLKFGWFPFFLLISALMGFIILSSISMLNYDQESAIHILLISEPLMKIMMFGTLALLGLDIVSSIFTQKKHKELDEEFFEFKKEVKPKK